jgi:hypothetical protein
MATGTTIVTDPTIARETLRYMVAADSPPYLDDSDLDRILALWQDVDVWAVNTQYNIRDRVIPTAANSTGDLFECAVAGTSDPAQEPDWEDVSAMQNDSYYGLNMGDVGASRMLIPDFTCAWILVGAEESLWDFEEAAHQGWMEKAGRCASFFNVTRGGNNYQFETVYKACLEMANKFGGVYII